MKETAEKAQKDNDETEGKETEEKPEEKPQGEKSPKREEEP